MNYSFFALGSPSACPSFPPLRERLFRSLGCWLRFRGRASSHRLWSRPLASRPPELIRPLPRRPCIAFDRRKRAAQPHCRFARKHQSVVPHQIVGIKLRRRNQRHAFQIPAGALEVHARRVFHQQNRSRFAIELLRAIGGTPWSCAIQASSRPRPSASAAPPSPTSAERSAPRIIFFGSA